MTPILAALLGGFLAAATPAPGDASCRAIPGWEQVLADEEVRWIVIGELHGTTETPAIFADAVCLTAEQRGPVVVALEQPSSDQAAIDAFMTSDGGLAARADFSKALMWNMPFKDGRSSEAIFAMIERLRQMHADGKVSRVVAFLGIGPADETPGDQGPHEARMAAIVRAAAVADATVVALVGNLHARTTEVTPSSPERKPFMPMAALLPSDQTLTFDAISHGGEAWTCQAEGCGAHSMGFAPEDKRRSRGVEMGLPPEAPYDGMLWLGTLTTASPPQATP